MAENKTDIGSQLLSFLSVKRMIALALTGVFCYMVITKKEVSTEFMTIFSSIISFYFGQSTARDAMLEKK